MDSPRIELRGMTKIYPGVVANDAIDIKVNPGEIHAVLGENGAGKSTLMKAIYGVVKPDQGQILWEGEQVSIQNPAHARKLGIGMVFQHFSLFETLTVTENIALAMDKEVRMDTLAADIREISQRYGLPLDPHRLVHSLSVGLRQRVEIVRCLIQKPRLLIMDEPTSVLTPQAVRKMFETLRQLSREGCSILYISHKLDEIRELCHTATIIRNGRVTGYAVPSQETPSSLARMMIGKELPVCTQIKPECQGQACLKVDGLNMAASDHFGTALTNIRMIVRQGEILGVAGVSGNGQRELLAAITGERICQDAATIRICGHNAGHMDAGQRRGLGMGFVPEDRLGRGAVPGLDLAANCLLTAFRHNLVKNGLICFGKTADYARECIRRFDVKCNGVADPITSLSGGNIQKFIIGREILQKPDLIVVSQPTWGVDVGAANLIRQAMIDLRNNGTAVLVVSEELDELFEICDRLVVMAKGHLSPSVDVCDTTREEIGTYMSGMFPGGPADAANPVSPGPVPEPCSDGNRNHGQGA